MCVSSSRWARQSNGRALSGKTGEGVDFTRVRTPIAGSTSERVGDRRPTGSSRIVNARGRFSAGRGGVGGGSRRTHPPKSEPDGAGPYLSRRDSRLNRYVPSHAQRFPPREGDLHTSMEPRQPPGPVRERAQPGSGGEIEGATADRPVSVAGIEDDVAVEHALRNTHRLVIHDSRSDPDLRDVRERDRAEGTGSTRVSARSPS